MAKRDLDVARVVTLVPAAPVGDRVEFARYLVGELGNKRSTAYTYETRLRDMERFLGKPAELFFVDDVRRFLRLSKYHPSTKNSCLVASKAYMRFRLIEGTSSAEQVMPIVNLRGPRQRRRVKKPLTLEEARTLLAACETSNEFRVIYLGLMQGMRVSDSAQIRREHVLSDRLRFVSVKNDKHLELPLHVEVERVMEKILEGSPTRDTLKMTCRSMAFTTGINFSSHRLRHTFSCRQNARGTQEGVVIELLGHEQPTVYRQHYAPVTWEQMEEAMARHDYGGITPRSGDQDLGVVLALENLAQGVRYNVRLQSGSSYMGSLEDTTVDSITLRLSADERVQFPRSAVASLTDLGREEAPDHKGRGLGEAARL